MSVVKKNELVPRGTEQLRGSCCITQGMGHGNRYKSNMASTSGIGHVFSTRKHVTAEGGWGRREAEQYDIRYRAEWKRGWSTGRPTRLARTLKTRTGLSCLANNAQMFGKNLVTTICKSSVHQSQTRAKQRPTMDAQSDTHPCNMPVSPCDAHTIGKLEPEEVDGNPDNVVAVVPQAKN